jgi:hypothetical protein
MPLSLQCAGGVQYQAAFGSQCPFAINSAEFSDLPFASQLSAIEFLYMLTNAPLEIRLNGEVPELIGGENGAPPAAFPTNFVGGETLEIEISGQPAVTVTFDVADQSATQVVNRINAAWALAGLSPAPAYVAPSGQIAIMGFTTGDESTAAILSGTAQAALGFAAPNVVAAGAGSDVSINGLALMEFGKMNPVHRLQVKGNASQVSLMAAGVPE